MKKILDKKKIIIFLVIIIILISVITIVIITKKNSNQDNHANSIYNDIKVDDLLFSDAIIEENNGLYTYNVYVTNNKSEEYKMNYIIFEFYDKEDNLITSMVGYAKDKLKPKEKIKVTSNVDKDIRNAKSVKIIIK